jgi:hypothetical protein
VCAAHQVGAIAEIEFVAFSMAAEVIVIIEKEDAARARGRQKCAAASPVMSAPTTMRSYRSPVARVRGHCVRAEARIAGDRLKISLGGRQITAISSTCQGP